MTKKLTNKNAHDKVSTAIKDLKKIKRGPRATGVWWLPIEVTKTEGIEVYWFCSDVADWCTKNDFPYPKNKEEENRILWLYDFRLFVLKRELKNFANDILDILVAERAILFYLWLAMWVILGFSAYHYFF